MLIINYADIECRLVVETNRVLIELKRAFDASEVYQNNLVYI